MRRRDAVFPLDVAAHDHRQLHVEVLVESLPRQIPLHQLVQLVERAFDRAHPVDAHRRTDLAEDQVHDYKDEQRGSHCGGADADELPAERRQVARGIDLDVAGHGLARGRRGEEDGRGGEGRALTFPDMKSEFILQ